MQRIPFVFLLVVLFCAVETTSLAQLPKPASQVSAGRSEPVTTVSMPDLVAEVNGERITEKQLAEEALRRHGKNVLKSEIEKALILVECHNRKLTITQEEIGAEIERMAGAFNFTTAQWWQMLETERGIDRQSYIEDTIRPLLAITKLAGQEITVTDADIQRACESRFGVSVQVRQIVLASKSQAESIRAELLKNPETFESLAKNKSIDPASKPFGGLLPPLRRHVLREEIEEAIFPLQPGEISPIVEWPPGNFIIFRCEQHFPAQEFDLALVRDSLAERIRDTKIREVSEKIFDVLLNNAKIDVPFTDPVRAAQNPEVAAVVNGHTITRKHLAKKCIGRYGKKLLLEMISKTLIEQECRKRNIQITDSEIDAEIREKALLNYRLNADGSPNVEAWLKLAAENAGVSIDIYRSNTIWPMLALKKMVRDGVTVTEEDVQRGFESNFGPKVRCRAIVLDNHRRALEVWEKAKSMPTEENFGDLSERYSVDSEVRLAKGVIPLIQKYGGQPLLEKEAFSLKPGELSQIIQEGPLSIILFCVEHTPAQSLNIVDVRHEIIADIYEKKLNYSMAKFYETIHTTALIDNYLEGKTSGPVAAESRQTSNK